MPDNFERAFAAVMRDEGSAVDQDKSTGEFSKYGITLKRWREKHPEATEDDIRALTPVDARAFYQDAWLHFHFDRIANPELAAKLFDIGINTGEGTAILHLQQAVNFYQPPPLTQLKEDGVLGPATANSINCIPAKELLERWSDLMHDYYTDVAENNPAHAKDLKGWLERLARQC